ncbi:ABC transporter permease [Spirosoma arboris]|uniref:ABC transporter permease n=1 Tax=Spirosoma arboris TaxID=2682092 RepID=UPI001D10D321|nr:ABC transporter permease [Spirosoma arboris]
MQALVSDENYLQTCQIPLVAGRFFEGRDADSLTIVLNEKAVRAMGYRKSGYTIGKQLRMMSDPRLFTVVGVSEDFHFNSMQQAIQPMLFFRSRAFLSTVNSPSNSILVIFLTAWSPFSSSSLRFFKMPFRVPVYGSDAGKALSNGIATEEGRLPSDGSSLAGGAAKFGRLGLAERNSAG